MKPESGNDTINILSFWNTPEESWKENGRSRHQWNKLDHSTNEIGYDTANFLERWGYLLSLGLHFTDNNNNNNTMPVIVWSLDMIKKRRNEHINKITGGTSHRKIQNVALCGNAYLLSRVLSMWLKKITQKGQQKPNT